MDIESFYQDGDMSFGMDGRISFANEAQYLRADGGGRAGEVAKWFPISKDCTELENTIAKAKTDLANNVSRLADPKMKSGEKRVLKDYNNHINKRIGELEDAYRKQGCALKKKQGEEAGFIETLKQISAPPPNAGAAGTGGQSKTIQYVLWGVGGLVVLAVGIFAVKKLRG
jgi:hypothetical protein